MHSIHNNSKKKLITQRKFFLKKMKVGCCAFLLFITPFSSTVFANPEGGQVSAGQATISSPDSNTVVVNQTSNKAVIDWRTFNIATQELTKFQQPNTSSIILNRVNPANGASTILGRMSANGQVWLINPAGVLIGATARIDAAGLLITTANIHNADFMAGHYHFVQSPDWNGAVINQGHIATIADNGLVALVAPGVENSGVIQANLGSVVLAAGKEFTVDFYGDQLIHFGINSQVTEKATAPDGTTLSAGVHNSGKIIAHGGKVILTAQTASDVMDHAINMDGYIEAKSAVARNGEIILNGTGGIVQVSGKINVAGKAKKQTGGTVKILGSKIAIVGDANINASGKAGGGEVLIGGNAHGAGPEPNADYVYFGPEAKVNASALANGNGGKVVVWANLGTQFYGNIQARGGINSGNGGWVETSGKENLSFAGYVNTSAPHGTIGTLLLDPTDITVQTGGTVYTPPYDFTTTGAVTILASGANSLSAQTSAVILDAHNNITFSNAVNMAAGGSLELHAGKTITINANISTTNGAITMTANDTAATAANRTAGAGNITMATGTSLNAGTADISLTINPTATGGFTPGTFSLRGLTANNITINGTSTSSTVTFNGNATATGNVNITSGGAITQAAATALTGTTLTAKTLKDAPGSAITLGNAGNDFTTVNLQARNAADSANSSGAITYRDATGVDIAAINTSSNITSFTTGGAITQSGAITVTGTSSFNAGANLIDLSTNGGSNSFTGAVSLTNSGTNTISITNSIALALGTSSIGQNFSATAGGNITQTGALTVAGNAVFAVTAGTSNILLNTQANNVSGTVSYGGTLTNIRDIGLRNTNASATVPDFSGITGLRSLTLVFNNAAINLPSLNLAATGNLAVTAGGAITQAGALTVPGTTNLNAGANAIDLSTNGASNSFTGAVTLTTTGANNVSLNNNRALVLAASSIGQNLAITAAGTITQTGALTVVGTSNFNSGSAAITLTAANAFTGAVSLTNTAGTVALTKTGALTIGTVNVGGNLNLTATGAISQTGTITATGGTTTLAAGAANNINFSNSSNDFATVAITTGKDVTLTDTNAIALGTSTISGNYSVTAGGNITQSGVLTVTGSATFALTNAATDILLSTQANNFTGTVGFGGTLSNIRNVSLRNTNAAANFPDFSGVTNLQNLTLTFNNTGMTFPALVLTNGGSLTVTTGGAISQTGAITVPGTASFSVGANTISLTHASNAFTGAVSLTNSGANDVALTNNIALVLGASTIAGGNLNVIANGAITQTGAIIANGALKTATFSAGSSNDITLSTATNNFTIAAIGSANNATLRDTNAIIMDTSTVSDTLDITAGNSITQNGTLTSTQLTAKTLLNAGAAITLNNAGNNVATINLKARNAADTANTAGAVSYSNAAGFDIVNIATTTTINLAAGGAITDSGNIAGTTLTTNSAGGTILDFGSNLTGFNATNTTSGNIQLTNTGNLSITGISQAGGGNVIVSNTGTTAITGTVNTGAGNLILSSTGAVTQTAAITAPTLTVTTLNNASAAITLSNTANEVNTINLQTRNAANTANVAGAITYRDATGFDVATIGTTSTISLTAGGSITDSGNIAGTTLTTNSSGGTILDFGSNLTGFNATNTTSGDIQLVNTGPLSITGINQTGGGDLIVSNTGTTAITGAVNTGTGNTALTSTGAVTQTAAITSSILTVKTLNDIGAAITLNNAGNAVSTINLQARNLADNANTAGDINYRDATGIDIAQIGTLGNLTLTAAGAITQSGAIIANGIGKVTTLIAGATNNITLNHAMNDFDTLVITSSNAVTLNDANALQFGAATSTVSGALNVTTSGNITQLGGALVISGLTTLTPGSTNNITLSNATNDFSTITITNGNNATLRDANTLTMGTSAVTNTLNITGGTAILQSGTLTGATLIAKTRSASTAPITLTDPANEFSSINLQARNVADTANAAGAITYRNATGFNLATIATTSTINLTAGGTITDSGNIAGTTLTTNSAGGTVLDFGSNLTGFNATNTTSGNIQLTNTGNLSITSISQVGGGDVIVSNTGTTAITGAVNTGTGNLMLSSTGAVTQTAAITAPTLTVTTLNNASAAITLSNTANEVDTINLRTRNAANTANVAGAITYRDATGFDVATIGTTSTISLTAGGSITDSGNIAGTTLTTNSIGGTILNFGSNLTGFNATNTTSGDILLVNTGPLSITGINQTGGGDLIVSNTGTTAITGAVNTGTGNTALTSTGAVTQTAAITSPILTVTTLNNAPAAITLSNAGNETATINLQTRNAANTATVAGAIVYRDTTGFNVATADTTSTVTLTAGNTITQSSAMGGTTLTVKTLNDLGADITLNNSNNSFTNVSLQTRNAADTTDTSGTIFYQNISGINLTALRTLGSATLIAGGAMTDGANMNVAGTLTATSVGGTTFNNANTIANFNATNTGGGVITLTNTAAPLTITGLTNAGGGAVTITNTGALAIADGVTLNTGNATLAITATDLLLNTTGTINSGSADTSITQNTVGGAIYLGDASGTGMVINGNALQRITANNLTFNAPNNGQIILDHVTAADTANIANTVTLTATTGNTGSITVGSQGATFKALTANADNGIAINGNLVTTIGNLALNADFDGIAAGNDALALNANLTATGTMTLSAANGGIILGTPVTLNGNGITINSPLNGTQALTLDAGATGNILVNANIGNVNPLTALHILNVNNLTNNAIINTVTYTQNAGSGIVNYGAGGLNATGATTMTANTVNGAITVGSLSLGTQFANLTGTVAGLSGTAAIKVITLLNTIGPGTHFFDGIDMYAPAPIPPTPPKPPTPLANNQINPALIFLYTLTQSGTATDPSTAVMQDYDLSLDTTTQPEVNAKNCVKLSSDISICSK